jgi:hypothetical protein
MSGDVIGETFRQVQVMSEIERADEYGFSSSAV